MHYGIMRCQVQQAIKTDAYLLLKSIMAIERHALGVTRMHPVNPSQPLLEAILE